MHVISCRQCLILIDWFISIDDYSAIYRIGQRYVGQVSFPIYLS